MPYHAIIENFAYIGGCEEKASCREKERWLERVSKREGGGSDLELAKS